MRKPVTTSTDLRASSLQARYLRFAVLRVARAVRLWWWRIRAAWSSYGMIDTVSVL